MSSAEEIAVDVGPLQSNAEEVANSITHGLGALLAVVGAIVLLQRAATEANTLHLFGCAVFAFSLFAVYTASTLSHVFVRTSFRSFFRTLDQGMIYLLIAGSYTPWATSYLHGGGWWVLTGAIWLIALGGCFSKLVFAHRVDAVTTTLYVVLGWLPLMGAPWFLSIVPIDGLWIMLAGGGFYTVGVVFLLSDHRVPFFHSVWHLFVMLGSAIQFYAIYEYSFSLV